MLSIMSNSNSKKRNELLVTFKGIKYGAFAGFIATWSISSLIEAIELLLELKIATFYSIMGISLGLNDVTTAAYAAFGLHLLTGSIIGVEKSAYAQSIQECFSWHRSRYGNLVSIISTNN
jgi:hypothetical protein